MPKKVSELAPLTIKKLTKKGMYAVGGVSGLYLQVSDKGARSWILRATVGLKRRDIGLGGYPDVGLSEAREKARTTRLQIYHGIDPVQLRQDARAELIAAQAKEFTFEQSAKGFLKSKSSEWKNAKHAKQWEATLAAYAYPVIGKLQVNDVELSHVTKILEPIWSEKTETAKRLRGRIENILDWATVRGYREGDNPARWKGLLDKVLPAPSKVTKVLHHKALSVDKVGQFILDLRQREGISARALEFLVLTAARSGEVRGATWGEIDLKQATWIIPTERMKAGKEHRVPLTPRVIALLEAMPRFEDVPYVFPAAKGGMISDMSMGAVLKRMGVDATVHGFRSTFRDWCAERTNYPREVAEMALAHTIENKVEAAYRRGDLFEKRRRMMAEWSRFCDAKHGDGESAPIRGVKKHG